MSFLKPATRALTGVFSVSVGLYGLTVTPDLMWFCVAMAAVGVLNFVVGVHDERTMRAAAKQAVEDRDILKQVQSHMATLVGPSAIPAHLQDLTVLKAAQIKGLVADLTPRMRAFQDSWDQRRVSQRFGHALGKSATQEERERKHHELTTQMLSASYAFQAEFNQELQPQTLAIWRELSRRLPDAPPNKNGWGEPILLKYNSLAGPSPVAEAANELDRLAGMLPDD